jgi:hypothetical protein
LAIARIDSPRKDGGGDLPCLRGHWSQDCIEPIARVIDRSCPDPLEDERFGVSFRAVIPDREHRADAKQIEADE